MYICLVTESDARIAPPIQAEQWRSDGQAEEKLQRMAQQAFTLDLVLAASAVFAVIVTALWYVTVTG